MQVTEKSNLLIREVGRLTLFMAVVFLLLFSANLRSRLYYHGPNYGFLVWIFFYCVLTGVGLLKSRKWAVLLLFLPGIFYGVILVYGLAKGASAAIPWALLGGGALINYLCAAALLAIPVAMLRSWHELRW